MPADSWKMGMGVNHVGAYQVSGIPFATASVDAMAASGTVVRFPYVTRWVKVENPVDADLKIGFSQNGINGQGQNYFSLNGNPTGNDTGVLELKVSEIWLSGSVGVSVIAGLTGILPQRVSGTAGPSWSGSIGVDSFSP
jgi:hypothetical protein